MGAVHQGLTRRFCIFHPALSTNLQELESRSRNNEVSILLLLANAAATERKSKSQIVNSHLHPLSAYSAQPGMFWEPADPTGEAPHPGKGELRQMDRLSGVSARRSHSQQSRPCIPWKTRTNRTMFLLPTPQFITEENHCILDTLRKQLSDIATILCLCDVHTKNG